MRRSVRPGHIRDSATEPPVARAIRFRAKRPITSVDMRLRWVTDTPALDWRIQVANPFNPETQPRHHLETPRISGGSSKWSAKSGFDQPRGVKAIEAAQPWVLMRQVAGQGAQVALRSQDFLTGPRPRQPRSARGAWRIRRREGPRWPARPLPVPASRCNRPASRPAGAARPPFAAAAAATPPSAPISLSCRSHATSGWRRMVPVEVQGASIRIPSKPSPFAALPLGRIGHHRFCVQREPREIVALAASSGPANGRPR